MKRTISALALGTIAAAGVAMAQEGARPGPRGMLMRADANGDGVVGRDEYLAWVDARFARMDANGNGRLDAGEGPRGRMTDGGAPRPDKAPPPPPGASPPPPAPVEGLTRETFRTREIARFEQLDANRDGRIDAAEMEAARPRHPLPPPHAPPPMPADGGGARPAGPIRAPHPRSAPVMPAL